jgi:hypothetical protein
LIERGEQAKMRSGVEQIRVNRILPHHLHRIVRRKAATNHALPRFAETAVRRIVGRSSPAR